MNFLAHTFLARNTGQAQVGAILGDLMKSASGFPQEVQREISVHRSIDSFTDSHEIVIGTKQYFRPETRRFAGILLDVFFDHLLTVHWSNYSNVPLPAFVAQVHEHLNSFQSIYPPRVWFVLERMLSEKWLLSYGTFEGVKQAIDRISFRLSRRRESFRAGLEDLKKNHDKIERGFETFFPLLVVYSEIRRCELDEKHVSRLD
ncbi:MAG: DUF479 domain-containing protein [Candidatus Competibacteraceae bacterium]|nr:DUF479 domain-containing protein [Candidatus Competibacteraceae bacterium]